MRHSAIETTMRYYVDLDAVDVANGLWAAWGPGEKTETDSGLSVGNGFGNDSHEWGRKEEGASVADTTKTPKP